jgi:hypothetical protein
MHEVIHPVYNLAAAVTSAIEKNRSPFRFQNGRTMAPDASFDIRIGGSC